MKKLSKFLLIGLLIASLFILGSCGASRHSTSSNNDDVYMTSADGSHQESNRNSDYKNDDHCRERGRTVTKVTTTYSKGIPHVVSKEEAGVK